MCILRLRDPILTNHPLPVFIPFHRVIRSDATLDRFGAGTQVKRKHIGLEKGGKIPVATSGR
jgi:hypothetical protein